MIVVCLHTGEPNKTTTAKKNNPDPVTMANTQLKNFMLGSLIFLAIAAVMSLFFFFYARMTTKDPSMRSANQWMGCGLTWLGVFYMWIAWSTFFQAQVYPYLTVVPTVETGGDE